MLALTSNVRVAYAIAALMTCHSQIAAGEVLRVGGTGAANGMIKSVGALFTAETGIAIELVPNLGTAGANSALARGVIDVAVAGRPLTPDETAKGLRAVAELHTPFGLVTSHPNPNGFKRSEIALVYRTDNPTWVDGTPIRIILRPVADSDTSLLGDLFPGTNMAMAAIRKRADLSVAATDQDNAEMVERTPGSLAGATLTQVETEKRDLRFVPIDGMTPSLENYRSGAYPLGKSLYFVLGAKKSPACERFLAFLRSPDGVAAMRKAGVLPRPE